MYVCKSTLFYQRSMDAGQGVQVQVDPTHNGESSCGNNENEVLIHRQFSPALAYFASAITSKTYINTNRVLGNLPSSSAI